MHLDWNPDQATFATVLGQMLEGAEAEFRNVEGWGRFDYGAALEAVLEEAGFFEAAGEPDLGPVAGAWMVHEVARRPVVLECAASALLRPFLGAEVPRPLAVMVDDAPGALRFLPMARALVAISDHGVRLAYLDAEDVREVESIFAYPMGELAGAPEWQDLPVDPGHLRQLWRVGVAAELCGAMSGALEAVLEHVRTREQFGRPLGSFQGVQHRLATDAVRIEAARLQMLRAAQSLTPDHAAQALAYAQGIATSIGYDLHQFMGAMGLTLEHPLHRWTYRMRLLRADMGGAQAANRAYADARWGAA